MRELRGAVKTTSIILQVLIVCALKPFFCGTQDTLSRKRPFLAIELLTLAEKPHTLVVLLGWKASQWPSIASGNRQISLALDFCSILENAV